VRRRLAASRTEAQRAIEGGLVEVNGIRASKASTLVPEGAALRLLGPPSRFVSRGGEKLDAALARFDVEVEGRRWLDAGASTGGFTDRLLRGGARQVIAVDVGYGQLDWRLRNDGRVIVLERFNIRHLTPDDLPWHPDGVVADLSFISLTLVIPTLVELTGAEADYVLLVKPQFEVGREAVGKGGVVRDPNEWRAALGRVVGAAAGQGLALEGVCASPLAGPAGNREFFVHFRPEPSVRREDTSRAIDDAIAEVS
jgi:23S rRNA (cytidine1920-2'-O)/16S rRNA (cytidine1409-2'-O)-methyltransferase